tara:strand:- start:125 stop:592 length:468 start_codon:yes stop_codon:yes gene_type:complete
MQNVLASANPFIDFSRSISILMRKIKKVRAYTLQELLVVLVIIGILILLALPSLMPLVTRTKTLEAQMQLKHVLTLEKSYYMMRSKYSSDLTEIGFEQEKTIDQGGNAVYQIEIIENGGNYFRARATALSDFDGDGQYNVWEIDSDEVLQEVKPD